MTGIIKATNIGSYYKIMMKEIKGKRIIKRNSLIIGANRMAIVYPFYL